MTSPVAIPDCEALDGFAQFLDVPSAECAGTRVMGTICGCPIPENACHLCGDIDTSLTNPYLTLNDLVDLTQLPGSPATRAYDCAYVQGALHTTATAGADMCSYAQEALQGPCCGIGDTGNENVFAPTTNSSQVVEPCNLCASQEKVFERPDFLVQDVTDGATSCAQFEGLEMERGICSTVREACPCEATCPLCSDGTPVPLPGKRLNMASTGNGMPAFETCGELAATIRSTAGDSDICLASQVFGRLCGCPQRENHCNLCGTVAPSVPKPEQEQIWGRGDVLSALPSYFQFMGEESLYSPMRCEIFESVQSQLYNEGDTNCYVIQFQSGACGCENTDIVTLVWAQIGSGIVSTLASLWVLVDIIFFRKAERRSTGQGALFYTIMAIMTAFNLVGGIAYAFGSAPMPVEGGYYLAHGGDATCTAQGFMSQLSLTAIFFNMILSVYFYLLVVSGANYKWKRVAKFILPNLGVLGVVMALAALPYYNVSLTKCGLAIPPIASSMIPQIIFFITPISIVSTVLIIMSVVMIREVYCKKVDDAEGNNLNDDSCSSNGDDAPLTQESRRQIFWENFNYSTICLFIWLPQFAQYGGEVGPEMFPLLVMSSIMLPSQGTLNALIYFRSRGCCCRKKKQEEAPKLEAYPETAVDDEHSVQEDEERFA